MKTKNIKNVGKNTWLIDFTFDGVRKRKTIHGTQQMAERYLIEWRNKLYRDGYGFPGPKKRVRFREYAKYYKDNYSRKKRSYENEKYRLARLVVYFGDMFLDQITPRTVNAFKKKRENDSVKDGTINNDLTLLRAMLNKAIDSDEYRIERNPVKQAGMYKTISRRMRILDHDEASRLIGASKNAWGGSLPLFLVIALNSGMRKMEILSLRWENINFADRFIEVTAERAKTAKGRMVPMNSVVREALQDIDRESQYVFPSNKSNSHVRHIKESFWRACKKAEIEDLTVHDLRHTAASRLVNDCGLSIVEAADILGHAKIEQTRAYVHPTKDKKLQGIERLGELFTRHESRHPSDPSPTPPKDSPHMSAQIN